MLDGVLIGVAAHGPPIRTEEPAVYTKIYSYLSHIKYVMQTTRKKRSFRFACFF